jgi:hypothetical protein
MFLCYYYYYYYYYYRVYNSNTMRIAHILCELTRESNFQGKIANG